MIYEAVIFDLDGTLLNSLEDLADSMNAALIELNCPPHPAERYRFFVGDGVWQLARRALPAGQNDEAQVEAAVRLMSAEYDKRWNLKTRPYPGMEEALDGLVAAGLQLSVLSNKPDSFTKQIVPALLPRWRFQPILGARPGVPIKPDPSAALEIAAFLGISAEKILYAGDSGADMRTANSAGMQAIGVSWGFRPQEELIQAGARRIIHHPLELLQLLEI